MNQTVGTPGLASGGRGAERGGVWEGHWGRAVPPPQKKNRFWISNRQIFVQIVCFLYSLPKAGLNAVLVRRMPKCQTLAICMPMNKPAAERGRRRCFICPDFTELDSLD